MQEDNSMNVFVKFLPDDMDNDKLYNLFSSFGVIISVKVMLNDYNGNSLG